MRLTESHLRKLVRKKIQESFEGGQGIANWLKVRETKNINELLGMMNYQFQQDFEEALEYNLFGDCDDLGWFEGESEALDMNPYQFMLEYNQNADLWGAEDIYEQGKNRIRWTLSIPIALHLIYQFHNENCMSFQYSFYGQDDPDACYEKVQEILLDIVDMYEFPSSFRDVISDQMSQVIDNTALDRQVGHMPLR